MTEKRTPFAPELDALRSSVVPYVEMAALMSDVDYSGLSDTELVAVTGLVSEAGFKLHSAEDHARYAIFMAEQHQAAGEDVDPRNLALGSLVRAAKKLRKLSEAPSTAAEQQVITLPSGQA